MAPAYQRPAAPVAARFPGDDTPGRIAAAIGWREAFRDPRLQALIELALRNNRDLRVAALQVELARAQARGADAELQPQVGVSASAPVSSKGGTTYQLGGNLSWELDLFGRLRSLKSAALERYLAQDATHRAAYLALIGEVANQYVRERAYAEQRALAARSLELATRLATMTRQLFEAGERTALDVVSADAQVANTRGEIARLERLHAQARNALVLLVGQPLPPDLPRGAPLGPDTVISDLAPGVPSEVLLRRPDVVAAEHTLRAANADIGAARAAFFPKIDLTGMAGLASSALSGLFSGGVAWGFTPAISAPLFDGGRNQANLDAATVRERIEVAQYERAIQTAFREVADALVARGALDRQLDAERDAEAAQRRRLDIATRLYGAGTESYLSVLDAQRELYGAQSQLIELRVQRLTNLVDLYRALGGGTAVPAQTARR